ncbi:MAG: DUF359 domain-containing protein [Thermoplasmatales archaeon]|nr:DUF359 domain-containing protein [Thermoplasmatales archaeon]MCW6169919.1 DUF359 domain-containing protein [Thermoplasmatales archaeon]
MQLESGSEFVLSDDARRLITLNNGELCNPEVFKTKFSEKRIVSVGDVTTERLEQNGIKPFLEVVDLKTKRTSDGYFTHRSGSESIKNAPGVISHDLFFLIERLMKGNGGRIEIEGEEDLSVIPIIFYSDQNTVIAYGIPDVGMACIEINENIKKLVDHILSRMEIRCKN